MGDERDVDLGYLSRVISGLVAAAVVAVTLDAAVAALGILAAVMVVVLAMTCLMLRGAL